MYRSCLGDFLWKIAKLKCTQRKWITGIIMMERAANNVPLAKIFLFFWFPPLTDE